MKRISMIWRLVCLAAASSALLAQVDARMLRQPDVSRTHITFVYAGDIWVVPKTGGTAQRLSSPEGEESFPRFSPDGSTIAFTGNYDGNSDIYVIPSMGGIPSRATHHPMTDRVLDWFPDGNSILYASMMKSGRARYNQLYRTSRNGGMPEKLAVPYGEFGAISPDGKWLAFMIKARDFRTWKRYRGGMAPDIWLFNLEDGSARNVTADAANDGQPMWHGSKLYFLSDRGPAQRHNIWSYEMRRDRFRQVTRFTDQDIHFPAVGPDDMVFEAGGRLYLLDLESERHREVRISVVTDNRTLKPYSTKVADLIFNASISPTGKRAVFEARGDVFTVPGEHGVIRNLTASAGVAERYPAWSPDAKSIAYWSDRSGEYELSVRNADGSGQETKVTSLGAGYRYRPYWSPDSSKLAFIDQAMRIQIFDRDSGQTTEVDKALQFTHGALNGFSCSWSSDSRWLAYTRDLESGATAAVFLYDGEKGERHQVTSGYYADSDPAFDPEGKYLYFFSNRTFRPAYSDLDNTWVYPNTTNIVAVSLRKDVPSPLAPRNDDEEVKEEEEKEKGEEEQGKEQEEQEKETREEAQEEESEEGEKEKEEPVEIDIDGFESRLVVLPPPAGNYGGLAAAKGKVIYRRTPRTGSAPGSRSDLAYWDLKERKEQVIVEGVNGFELSADGSKVLVRSRQDYAILDVKPKQKMDKKLRTAELEATVDPRKEWAQIFNDAWRFERDYFYDPNMHGVDWDAMREQYGRLMKDAVTRWDVNFVVGELIAELNASHTYRGGGQTERPERRQVGLLGVDWARENGAFRIKKIVRGAAWDSHRSPLDEPGADVSEGDYILAVNGIPLDTSADPYAAFQGLGDQTVELTVNSEPRMQESRTVLVKTMTSEQRLRNLQWIESNRKRVEEATGGRVGYIYVPNTGIQGQTELVRQFQAQFHKEGLIIDERFNSGGQIPDRFVELLHRPALSFWAIRDGRDWQWPPVAHFGPKVMLINGWSGSGGDAFPYYFREAGLGPLIGTRTWGGLIGISGAPPLLDGGRVTVPTFRMYATDGEWFREGHGVEPDIEVKEDPAALARGRDPQLERAIEEVLEQLRNNPVKIPRRPPYEKRTVDKRRITDGRR